MSVSYPRAVRASFPGWGVLDTDTSQLLASDDLHDNHYVVYHFLYRSANGSYFVVHSEIDNGLQSNRLMYCYEPNAMQYYDEMPVHFIQRRAAFPNAR